MDDIQKFLLYAHRRSMRLGSQGRLWMIDELMTEPELQIVIAALKQGYITLRRVTSGGSEYLEIVVTDDGIVRAYAASS